MPNWGEPQYNGLKKIKTSDIVSGTTKKIEYVLNDDKEVVAFYIETSNKPGATASNDKYGYVTTDVSSSKVDGTEYLLGLKELPKTDDPVKLLDVSLLSDLVLSPLLGIKDPRTDKRIDFVGGMRGLKELERRVDSKEMAVARYLCCGENLFLRCAD